MHDGSRIEELLTRALDHLDRGDTDAVERLIADHPDDADRLRALLERVRSLGLQTTASEPDTIGDYRILDQLGIGGMGVVYEAEHQSLGRRVALKCIRPERLLTSGSRRRFWREAQAVSQLDHPNICPVYEVGEQDGTPYMVMRRCTGQTLQEAIAERASGTPSRGIGRDELPAVLGAAEKLARALQHAHDQGFVHRDVKPGNIILEPRESSESGTRDTGVLEPVILDFGLARRAEEEGLTRSGDAPGTPAYMAPEQIDPARFGTEASALDGRTDVHALGVTLFEWITLQAPFSGNSVREIHECVLHQPPPSLRGRCPWAPRDLQVVLAKAMEKDPHERYATAAAFADDLRRLRELQPIAATAPGPALRLRRWSQRNPAAAAAVVILSVSVAAISALAFRAEEARAEAVEAQVLLADEVTKSDAVQHFLLQRILGGQDFQGFRRADMTLGELLDRVLLDVDRTRFKHREVEAAVRHLLAGGLDRLGRTEEALAQARRACEIRDDVLDPEDPARTASRLLLAGLLRKTARYEEAVGLANTSLEEVRSRSRADPARTRSARVQVANTVVDSGRVADSLEQLRSLAAEFLALPRWDLDDAADAAGIAAGLVEAGAPHKALELLDRARIDAEEQVGIQHVSLLSIRALTGVALRELDRTEDAEQEFRVVVDMGRELLPAGHPRILEARVELGTTLADLGHHEEADRLLRPATGALEQRDPDGLLTAKAHNALGYSLKKRQRFAEAREHYERALEIRRARLPAGHPKIANVLNNLGSLEGGARAGNKQRAAQLHEQALAIRLAALGKDHAKTRQSIENLTVVLAVAAELEALRELERRCTDWYGPDSLVVGRVLARLSFVFRYRNHLVEAEQVGLRALEILARHQPDEADLLRRAMSHVSMALHHRVEIQDGQHLERDAALTRLEALRAGWEQRLGADDPALALPMQQIARLLHSDRPAEALAIAERADGLLEGAGLGRQYWLRSNSLQLLQSLR